jgi:putative transcriptional regulator
MALDTCLKHHFLLAMPSQRADYFSNTITYVCEHNEEGAMGFMVNRPMNLTVAELLEQLGISGTVTGEQPVLEGGPVKTERGFILHSDDVHFDASLSLGNGLMLSTARQTLEAIGGGNGPKRYLVALGYAGWAADNSRTKCSRTSGSVARPTRTSCSTCRSTNGSIEPQRRSASISA